MIPQREILWNVPSVVMNAVYVLSMLCAVWIVFWFVRRGRLWEQGHAAADQLGWVNGIRRLAAYLLTHRTIRRDAYAGVMHVLIFWGFVVLLIATTLVGIQHHLGVEFLKGTTYLIFSLSADLGGVAFCLGVAMALWRRRRFAWARSHNRLATTRLLPDRSTTWVLWLLFVLGLSGFLVEGARIAHDFPPFEVWSPVGYVTAKLLAGMSIEGETAVMVHRSAWIGHAILVIVFFVVVPLTFLRHILLAAVSVARPAGRPGVLSCSHPSDGTWSSETSGDGEVFVDDQNRARLDEPFEAVTLANFRRVDLLQADACLTCGLCNEVCPADAAGKPLQPRSIVLGLREQLAHPEAVLAQQVSDDALWSCTTCNACDVACPINIHIVEKIVTFRRGRVAKSAVPDTAVEALESSAQKFNPFSRPNSARMEWSSGLEVPVAASGEQVELLYWVGCAGAFDPAGRGVSRAMIQILNHLKINYRVLGCRERCTGDPARRLGEETLWQELAATNQQAVAGHNVKTILTHCPHCFNTMRNEYPSVGPMPEVVHHSQWLRDQLDDGSLSLTFARNDRITFHDPCYLSRANGEVEAPRKIIDALYPDQRIEMFQNRTNSFCCGGGGGQLWLDVRGQTRVENIRASQVEETGAHTVATACPFCHVMLEAGRTSLEEDKGNWRVKDIAELIVENLNDD